MINSVGGDGQGGVKRCLITALVMLLPAGALAEEQTLQSQRWQTTVDSKGLLRTNSASLLGHLDFDVGLWGGYERNPLTLTDRNQPAAAGSTNNANPLVRFSPYRRRVAALIESRVASELTFSVGLFNWVQLFGTVPVTLYQDRGAGISSVSTPLTPLNQFNPGDVRLGAKIRILRAQDQLVDLAFIPQLTLPTGLLGFRAAELQNGAGGPAVVIDPGVGAPFQGYSSEGFPTLQPELAISREFLGVFLGANGGVRIRRPYEVQKLTISHELIGRVGVGFKGKSLARTVPLMRFFPVEAGLEASASTGINHPYVTVPFLTPGASGVQLKTPPPLQSYQAAAEVGGFLGVDVLGFHPFVGASVGVLPGYGTPDFRMVGGLRFATDAGRAFPSRPDRDRDGVVDTTDRCPDVPGLPQHAGCPPADSDTDGVWDELDRCPLEPETINGNRDDDGCPEAPITVVPGEPLPPPPDAPDLDGDFNIDGEDLCPDEGEDEDGFEDQDGCPEPDNDGDGIEDAADACPQVAETINGHEDDDGCPDEAPPDGPDADQDGILNDDDRCPYEPETGNGVRDDDGCPDVATRGGGRWGVLIAALMMPSVVPEQTDGDGDGVLDVEDPCPVRAEDVDGFEDDDGCPEDDNDQDGIADGEDACPLEAESVNGHQDTDGCPDEAPPEGADADGDGVPNDADRCPMEAETTNGARDDDGCPERGAPASIRPQARPELTNDLDRDGVADEEDACPRRPEDLDGFADEDGCPERDNDDDGVRDTADRCPLEAETLNGFRDDDGCPDRAPDSDGDGVADASDRCPMEREDANGARDHDGCPDEEPAAPVAQQAELAVAKLAPPAQPAWVEMKVDTDGDGLLDLEDPCPRRAEDVDGFQDEDGCPEPDNDRDGVADASDTCPLEAEVINSVTDEDGCPDVGVTKVEMQMQSHRVAISDKVYFRTNSAQLSPRSFKLLGQVAGVLKAYPEVHVLVEGHTDDVGGAAYNDELSQHRAEAVVEYLVNQGIDRGRLEARGYGFSRPVVTDGTDRGREANRRVEFLVKGDGP